jgi:hypothetical protein
MLRKCDPIGFGPCSLPVEHEENNICAAIMQQLFGNMMQVVVNKAVAV